MGETAAQRAERMERAAAGRGRVAGAPARRTAVRTKPARMTVDMPPELRRRLKGWTAYAESQLDMLDVPGAEVVRILIETLTTGANEPGWDPDFHPVLVRRVLDEVRRRHEER